MDRIGHPDGKFMGAIENGNVASFEERSLPPDSVNEYYYQYEFAVEELPENWTIRAGKAALHNWGCSWGLNPPVSRRQRVM